MKFIYKNNTYEIERNNNTVLVNDETDDSAISKIDENTFKLSKNGKTFTGYAAEDKDKAYVFIDGEYYEFKKAGEDDSAFDEVLSDENIERIHSPMPGSVVELVVKQGQEVKNGDPVIIVEAMKMETTLYTSIDGVVKEINVKKDEQISADTDLVVIEKPE